MSDCPGCDRAKPDGEIYCRKCAALVSGGPVRPAGKGEKAAEAVEDIFNTLFKTRRPR